VRWKDDCGGELVRHWKGWLWPSWR